MSIERVNPHQARQLIEGGAVLFDIREPDEYAREHIPHARNVPLARLAQSPLQTGGAHAVIFHCKGGARTSAHATKLASATGCVPYILEGGLDAWKGAGLPVATHREQPLEIMRQVQITAGALVLLGVVLGATVQPLFYGLAGFVGSGLMFAGISGTCAMASLLRRMPWNRRVV
jgi:rhodanese-related sulfurtransferase